VVVVACWGHNAAAVDDEEDANSSQAVADEHDNGASYSYDCDCDTSKSSLDGAKSNSAHSPCCVLLLDDMEIQQKVVERHPSHT
jgi:hypothetical protein